MSIEAIKPAAEFNRYFTSANGVDVPAKVSVSRDEWRALFDAIQQAEAKTDEPAAWRYQPDDGLKFPGFTQYEAVAVSRGKPGTVIPLYTHPAPGVPDGYVLVPIEPTQAMLKVQTWDFNRFYSPREIWAAMLAAK